LNRFQCADLVTTLFKPPYCTGRDSCLDPLGVFDARPTRSL